MGDKYEKVEFKDLKVFPVMIETVNGCFVYPRTFQRLVTADTDTDTDTDTEIYNVWNSKRVWQGAKKVKAFNPDWTYEKVLESEYPSKPTRISDGLYLVEYETGRGMKRNYLKHTRGGWYDSDDGWRKMDYDFTIIEEYKKVCD